MYPISAFAYTPSTIMPPIPVASVIAAAPGSPSIGSLPVTFVGGSVADAEVYNNTQGGPQFYSASATPSIAAATAGFNVSGALPPTPGTISSFPSLFMAQLLAQDANSAETQRLIVTYETMLNFSQVKYMPSDAGKPAPASPMLDFLKTLTKESANSNPAPAIAANSNKTVSAAAAQAAPAVAVQVAAPQPRAASEARVSPVSPALRPSAKGSARSETLAGSNGAQAYALAGTRLDVRSGASERVDLIAG